MDINIVTKVMDGKGQLLDVRTQEEWDNGHADRAIHIPLQELTDAQLSKLDLTKPIYTYCQSGNRAGQAADFLRKKGFEAHNIGGLDTWETAGGGIT